MLTTLLTKENSPLDRLALHRIQLDARSPSVTMETEGCEGLVYSLVGGCAMHVNGRPLGRIGGRRSVIEPRIDVVRVPSFYPMVVTCTVDGYAADLLWVTWTPPDHPRATGLGAGNPYVHRSDAIGHEVGTGCYHRTVAEVPTPAGYAIHCGETRSDGIAGCWSSWPSHCAPEERGRYAEHEEIFFVLTAGSFLMREDGRYCTGDPARGVREIHNEQALVVPLGSHELTTSPGDIGVYVWAYVSFLKKKYNAFSHESIKSVYVK